MILEPYKIYKSEIILENPANAKEQCFIAMQKWEEWFSRMQNADSTWSYSRYNIFSVTSGMPFFYEVYKEICEAYRDWTGNKGPAWMLAWLNSHSQEEVLDWHGHQHSQYHGYVVMDERDHIRTTTEFHNFKIINELGNIYIGPCGYEHRVVVEAPYEGVRHTLAFQITTNQAAHKVGIPVF